MKKAYLVLIGLFAFHLFLLATLQFTAWPEMFSYPYLRNSGFLLYKDIIHPYPPFLTLSLASIYGLFGYGLNILKILTWLVILFNDLLIFLIVKKISQNQKQALLAVAFYIFLQPFLQGNMLWFDLAIVPAILLGTLLLLGWEGKRVRSELFFAGVCLGISVLIKQTAALFLIFSVFYLLFRKISVRELAYFFLGPLIMGTGLIFWLFGERILADFVNWVIIYPLSQWSRFPGYVQMNLGPRELVILLLLFLVPGLLLFRQKSKIFKDKNLQLILPFLLGGLISVYPRFSFFHLQSGLAFLAIIVGYGFKRVKVRPLLLVGYSLLLVFIVYKPVVARDWGQEARFFSQDDIELASLISEKVSQDEQVFLLGFHSGSYSLADRLPPKPWADNFGWYLEIPGVQEKILAGWQKNPAKIIFWQEPEQGNWFDLGVYQPKEITKWVEENYTKKEEVKPGIWIWEKRN